MDTVAKSQYESINEALKQVYNIPTNNRPILEGKAPSKEEIEQAKAEIKKVFNDPSFIQSDEVQQVLGDPESVGFVERIWKKIKEFFERFKTKEDFEDLANENYIFDSDTLNESNNFKYGPFERIAIYFIRLTLITSAGAFIIAFLELLFLHTRGVGLFFDVLGINIIGPLMGFTGLAAVPLLVLLGILIIIFLKAWSGMPNPNEKERPSNPFSSGE